MATDVVTFKGAGLPSTNIGAYRDRIQQARDQVSVSNNTPFLNLGKADGIWSYGPKDLGIEEGSLWAINPLSMKIGIIAWPPAASPLKTPVKRMVPIFDKSTPFPDKHGSPPPNGGEWDDCVSFELQCIGGKDPKATIEDVGVTVEYQQNSYGGKQAFDEVAKQVFVQLEQNPQVFVPVVELLSESYQHSKWGTVWKPIFHVHKWVSMTGDAAPEAIEAPEEEAAPRGRRGSPLPMKVAEAAPEPAPAEIGNAIRRRRQR